MHMLWDSKHSDDRIKDLVSNHSYRLSGGIETFLWHIFTNLPKTLLKVAPLQLKSRMFEI